MFCERVGSWTPGGGVLPYKGLMGTCSQPGYVFRDFCLKQGIKNRNSVLNRVGKSAIFVLNRVRVWGAAPHLPTQEYIEYPPPPGGLNDDDDDDDGSEKVAKKMNLRPFTLYRVYLVPFNLLNVGVFS